MGHFVIIDNISSMAILYSVWFYLYFDSKLNVNFPSKFIGYSSTFSSRSIAFPFIQNMQGLIMFNFTCQMVHSSCGTSGCSLCHEKCIHSHVGKFQFLKQTFLKNYNVQINWCMKQINLGHILKQFTQFILREIFSIHGAL